jgi:ribosome maturation factor RimP
VTNDIDLAKLTRLIQATIDEMGLRFYDLEFNKVSRILRVFIDKEKGAITIQDCQSTSNALSRALDDSDMINFPYTLELSSPGIERPLKKPEHYIWATGKVVEIDTGTERIKGYLRGTRNEGIVIALGSEEKIIPYGLIKKARVIEEISHGK